MLRSPRTPHNPSDPSLLQTLQTANQTLADQSHQILQRVRDKWRRGEQLRHQLEMLKKQYEVESQSQNADQLEVEVYMRTPQLSSSSQLNQLEQKFDQLLRQGRLLEGDAKLKLRLQLRQTAEEIRKLRGGV